MLRDYTLHGMQNLIWGSESDMGRDYVLGYDCRKTTHSTGMLNINCRILSGIWQIMIG